MQYGENFCGFTHFHLIFSSQYPRGKDILSHSYLFKKNDNNFVLSIIDGSFRSLIVFHWSDFPVQSELELESLIVARNQLMQHWTSSLLEMGRQDEALGAMQEAVR